MAYEADCGVSTVLKALRVATTAGSLVPGEWRTTFHLRPACAARGPFPKALLENYELKTRR